MDSGTIRVLLADDHTLVRAGVRALLGTVRGVKVVADAADGAEALKLALSHHPDVALLDIGMPGVNGLDVLTAMRRELPKMRVIMLSMHANEEYVWRARASGAAGYLLKDATPRELETAIRTVARGGEYVTPALTRESEEPPPATDALRSLTPRHREILRLIAEGNTNRQIASHLGIRPKTVDAHRTELMARLDIHDVVGLVRFAIRTGLVSVQ